LKSGYLVHIGALITLVLGAWLFFGNSNKLPENRIDSPLNIATQTDSEVSGQSAASIASSSGSQFLPDIISATGSDSQGSQKGGVAAQISRPASPTSQVTSQPIVGNPDAIISDYIGAWRNRDKVAIEKLWPVISSCEPCLARMVDMIVNRSLEEGLMLEAAIKMAALNTDTVLPVFDAIIDPSGNRSAAIILSEKIINNGRPEFVTKIFDLIYNAQKNGYDNFARQLTWVISKLENHDGIQPILDTISGRSSTSPEFSAHVSNVFSKVVYNLPDSPKAAEVIAKYYQEANEQEQQKLWQAVSQHSDTLVMLGAYADRNGQIYVVQKYASAISELPNLQAVDGLVKLHMSVEYSPDYLAGMLKENVVKNPTFKVLHKLEDYMRDPDVPLGSRIFAAEGLLSVKENRQARYILEKAVDSSQEVDPELQAYISGRL